VRTYLDASVLVALLTQDPHTARTVALLRGRLPTLVLSTFARTEFASAVVRRLRMAALTEEEARAASDAIDLRAAQAAERLEVEPADVRAAERFVRRLGPPLKAPDAVNIAIVLRTGATLATFDIRMAAAARAFRGEVAEA
jgi:predicted nucleic acid-binding protein